MLKPLAWMTSCKTTFLAPCLGVSEEMPPWLTIRIYRKILKISPGACIFQRPFLRGLYSEEFIYGGNFAFQNRLGYPYSWKQNYRFCFVLLCIWGKFSKYKPLGGLYLEGRFNGRFFALPVWGTYIWMGLYIEGLIFEILRYTSSLRCCLLVWRSCNMSPSSSKSCKDC